MAVTFIMALDLSTMAGASHPFPDPGRDDLHRHRGDTGTRDGRGPRLGCPLHHGRYQPHSHGDLLHLGLVVALVIVALSTMADADHQFLGLGHDDLSRRRGNIGTCK